MKKTPVIAAVFCVAAVLALVFASGCINQPGDSPTQPVISDVALSLDSDIALKFYVPESSLKGYKGAYLNATVGGIGRNYLRLESDESGKFKTHTLEKISPDDADKVIRVSLYASKDGENQPLLLNTTSYSVKDYCMNQINKAGVKNEVTTICVDLLNYGSAVQTYLGETNTSKLVNNGLTQEQKGWASQSIDPALTSVRSVFDDGYDSAGIWRAAGMNLYPDISLVFKFTFDGDISDLSAEITYGKNKEKKAYINTFGESTYGDSSKPCKYVEFDEADLVELNYPITVVLKNKNGVTSKTLVYSADSYAIAKTGEESVAFDNLLTAAMKYIRSGEKVSAAVQYGDSGIEFEKISLV